MVQALVMILNRSYYPEMIGATVNTNRMHKGRSPMDVLSTMTRFGRLVQEDRAGGSYDWEQEMARATLRVAELIQAGNGLDLQFEPADGEPAHWRMNVNGIERFLRALRACQPTPTPPVL